MAGDDSEQPTQVLSGPPTPPSGGTATLEPHEPQLDEGGPGSRPPMGPPTGYGGDGGGDDWGDGGDGGGGDKRVAILAAIVGILVVVILFLVLEPGNDNDTATPNATPTTIVESTPAATATPAATDQATPTGKPESGGGTKPSPTATPNEAASGGGAPIDGGAANVPTLESGSVTKWAVSQNDTVTFKVKNDADTTQEVHVHGYDKKYEVPAGETQTISFKANLTGIFTIEFEDTSTQIGELTVNP